MEEITNDMLAARYVELREQKSQQKRLFDAELAVFDEKMDIIAEVIRERLDAANASSIITTQGRLQKSTTSRFVLRDSGEFLRFVKETNAPELLQMRVSEAAVKEYIDANGGHIPDGVGIDERISVTVVKR